MGEEEVVPLRKIIKLSSYVGSRHHHQGSIVNSSVII